MSCDVRILQLLLLVVFNRLIFSLTTGARLNTTHTIIEPQVKLNVLSILLCMHNTILWDNFSIGVI